MGASSRWFDAPHEFGPRGRGDDGRGGARDRGEAGVTGGGVRGLEGVRTRGRDRGEGEGRDAVDGGRAGARRDGTGSGGRGQRDGVARAGVGGDQVAVLVLDVDLEGRQGGAGDAGGRRGDVVDELGPDGRGDHGRGGARDRGEAGVTGGGVGGLEGVGTRGRDRGRGEGGDASGSDRAGTCGDGTGSGGRGQGDGVARAGARGDQVAEGVLDVDLEGRQGRAGGAGGRRCDVVDELGGRSGADHRRGGAGRGGEAGVTGGRVGGLEGVGARGVQDRGREGGDATHGRDAGPRGEGAGAGGRGQGDGVVVPGVGGDQVAVLVLDVDLDARRQGDARGASDRRRHVVDELGSGGRGDHRRCGARDRGEAGVTGGGVGCLEGVGTRSVEDERGEGHDAARGSHIGIGGGYRVEPARSRGHRQADGVRRARSRGDDVTVGVLDGHLDRREDCSGGTGGGWRRHVGQFARG